MDWLVCNWVLASLVFAYCSVSFEKYTENLKILGKYEKKKAERVKGICLQLVHCRKFAGICNWKFRPCSCRVNQPVTIIHMHYSIKVRIDHYCR